MNVVTCECACAEPVPELVSASIDSRGVVYVVRCLGCCKTFTSKPVPHPGPFPVS